MMFEVSVAFNCIYCAFKVLHSKYCQKYTYIDRVPYFSYLTKTLFSLILQIWLYWGLRLTLCYDVITKFSDSMIFKYFEFI